MYYWEHLLVEVGLFLGVTNCERVVWIKDEREEQEGEGSQHLELQGCLFPSLLPLSLLFLFFLWPCYVCRSAISANWTDNTQAY